MEEFSNISNEFNFFDGYYGYFFLFDIGIKLVLYIVIVGVEVLSFVFFYEGNYGLID